MQKIYENITSIIKLKGITRKEFADKLINLQPKVNRTAETPTLSTIYGYLNGRISIPIDLIPFIAEALNVTEQELFDTTEKTRKRCFKYFLENASESELEFFNNLINSQMQNNINFNYTKVIMGSKTLNEKLESFIALLEYAPANFLDMVISKLKEYKTISTKF